MVVGTNGGGDYWFIDTIGSKAGLWFWDHEACTIKQDCKTFQSWIGKLRRDAKEPAKWQRQPVQSSFAASCPPLERFGFFISASHCEIECQDSDRPLTEKKLRDHGIDIKRLSRCILRIVAVLAKCDSKALGMKGVPKPSKYGMLTFSFAEPPVSDPRYQGVGANIFRGNIYVTLYGPIDTTPPPNKTGIDWREFRNAVAELLEAIHPDLTKVKVSQPKRGLMAILTEQWNYDLNYSLK